MFKKILDMYIKIRYLKSCGWYKNLNGGYTESHCMSYLSLKEIWNMSIEEIRRNLNV